MQTILIKVRNGYCNNNMVRQSTEYNNIMGVHMHVTVMTTIPAFEIRSHRVLIGDVYLAYVMHMTVCVLTSEIKGM